MSIPDDPCGRELLEYGRHDLEWRFDPELNLVRYQTELGIWHDPRDSLWYALDHVWLAVREESIHAF